MFKFFKRDISSLYNDAISKGTLIESGSPAVYQLRSKKEIFGSLTRVIVGDKNLNKTNKTILLVGEMGSGKSTLINTLVNYTMGVKFEDNIWFEIVERGEGSQTESQTSDVVVYEIFDFKENTVPFSLTIIDTPGFGDTRGIEHDVIIRQRLLDLFRSEEGVHEINAVGLVMKASDYRLSDRLRYIFDSVVSLFGKDIENRIVALITHSDEKTPIKALKVAKMKCAKTEKNEPIHFSFENCQTKLRTEENKKDFKKAWDLTMMKMGEFRKFLEKSTPKNMKTTIEVLNIPITRTACINNLQDRIKLIELKQKEIQQIQEALKKYEQKMEKNEKFTLEVDEVYKEKEVIDGGKWWLMFFKEAVCCKVCEENCQYPGCTMAQSPEGCEVMKDGCCTVCTKKCTASAHVKDNWRFVTKTRKVQKTEDEMKEKYEKNKSESEKKGTLLENLEKEMKELTAEKNQLLEDSYQHVVKLEEIAVNVCSVSTCVHLDFLIEKIKEKGDRGKVQKLEEMKNQMDEGIRAVLQHKINNTSSKYKKFLSNSSLIRSGSPALYQLTPKKEMFGTLTRLTIGQKKLKKRIKTILLVGETGTGKSTLINTLVNYTMGVEFEDNIWFEIVENETAQQSKSQTSDVMVYEIYGFEGKTLPYSLTIIDTPGYGSTRGIKHDLIIRQRLLDLFRSEDGVHEINAVGLVIKASENRLTDRLRYIFDSVVSLFGKDLEENIVTLITNSNGLTPENVLGALEDADIKCAKDEDSLPVYFLFDNCQDKERTEKNKLGLDNACKVTKRGLDHFIDYLKKSECQKLKTTIEVLKIRIRLAACTHNLEERIKMIELNQKEIQQTQEALKKRQEKMKKNEKFTVEVDEVYKEKEKIKGGMWLMFYKGAVCCTVCEENCHYPGCTMAWYPSQCEVMNNGRCTVCTNKCPVSDHVKEEWRFVTKTRTVQKTEDEMKEKYEKNKSESEKKGTLLENLEKEMKELTAEKDRLLEDSYQHVVKLEEIALNVESLSTFVNLDFLIEKMKEKGDTEKVQKLEEMESRVDEGTRAGLQYMFDKLTGKEPKKL